VNHSTDFYLELFGIILNNADLNPQTCCFWVPETQSSFPNGDRRTSQSLNRNENIMEAEEGKELLSLIGKVSAIGSNPLNSASCSPIKFDKEQALETLRRMNTLMKTRLAENKKTIHDLRELYLASQTELAELKSANLAREQKTKELLQQIATVKPSPYVSLNDALTRHDEINTLLAMDIVELKADTQ
jgi:hypothetical protein